MEKDAERQVFVVRDARVHLQRISTGLETDNLVEVVSGLAEGDLVVVADLSKLKDGDRVRVQEGDEA